MVELCSIGPDRQGLDAFAGGNGSGLPIQSEVDHGFHKQRAKSPASCNYNAALLKTVSKNLTGQNALAGAFSSAT